VSDTEIARIQGYLVEPNLRPLILTGQDRPETRALELVCLTLADGSQGVAGTTTGWMGEEKGRLLTQFHERAGDILHRDASRPVEMNAELLGGCCDALPKAASLYDIAIWDAFARHLSTPLWKLLGGYRDSVPVYASTPAFHSIDEYVEITQSCIEAGYPAIKFHMNCDPKFDLAMVDAIATSFSSHSIRFMVDLEQRYSIDDAITLGRKLSDLAYDWMEAPLADTDLAGYVALNDSVGVDVLPAGNTLIGLSNWEKGLSMGAWSRLRCDATNAGGITVACQAMSLASAHGVANEIQSYGLPFSQYANLAVMLARPGCTWFEQAVPDELFSFGAAEPLALDGRGHVVAPVGSGTGLTVDWEAIEAHATNQFDVY
jgi:L-alanine-DL-glutamate epimerase-like enolase superfamily enzyme